MLDERFPAVEVPEEPRVGEAGGKDLAIALDDRRAAVLRLDICGADEGVGKLSRAVLADEVFLVHTRGELNDFGRHFEICGVEPTEQRDRPFGEARVLDHEALVLDQDETRLLCDPARAVPDDRGAFLVIDDHMGGAQFDRVVVGPADGDVARMVEAVTERHGAARDAVQLAFDDLAVEQGHDAGQGPHPAQGFAADRRFAPAHRLGPGKIADDGGDRFGEHVSRRAARQVLHREQGCPALHIACLEPVARHAVLATEAFHRLVRRSDRRPLHLFARRRGVQWKIAGDQGEAARRGPYGDGADRDTRGVHLPA